MLKLLTVNGIFLFLRKIVILPDQTKYLKQRLGFMGCNLIYVNVHFFMNMILKLKKLLDNGYAEYAPTDITLDHHHSCRSHATNTAFISSTTLRCLSIHLAVAPDISTSWYQYPFSLGFS